VPALLQNYHLELLGSDKSVSKLEIMNVKLLDNSPYRGWFGRARTCHMLRFQLPEIASENIADRYSINLIQKLERKIRVISRSPYFVVRSQSLSTGHEVELMQTVPPLTEEKAESMDQISRAMQKCDSPAMLYCGNEEKSIHLIQKIGCGGVKSIYSFRKDVAGADDEDDIIVLPNLVDGSGLMAQWPAIVEEEYEFSQYALRNGLLAQSFRRCEISLQSDPEIRIPTLVAPSFNALKKRGSLVMEAKRFSDDATDLVQVLKRPATYEDLLPLVQSLLNDIVTALRLGYPLNLDMSNMILVPREERYANNRPRPLSEFQVRLFLFDLTSKHYRTSSQYYSNHISPESVKRNFMGFVCSLMEEINYKNLNPIRRTTYTSREEINRISENIFNNLTEEGYLINHSNE
jgi:hypothetical protein